MKMMVSETQDIKQILLLLFLWLLDLRDGLYPLVDAIYCEYIGSLSTGKGTGSNSTALQKSLLESLTHCPFLIDVLMHVT